MKKLLLIVLAAAVVLWTGSAVLSHYKNYQNKQAEEAKVAAQAETVRVSQERDAEVQKVAQLVEAHNTLRVECEKGVAAYELLTTFAQSQTPRPVCGPANPL